VNTITKEQLIQLLKEVRSQGWMQSGRQGNCGGVGNTLEDCLGIKENNLPIPNAAEWELKCQRKKGGSLLTLFHMEPSPQALKFVPAMLLPDYGWPHKKAGGLYGESEMSFRQTINAACFSERGFKVVVDRGERKVMVSFDSSQVSERLQPWLQLVASRRGLSELNPQPYWGFDDLFHKAGSKLKNCFYVLVDHKFVEGIEYLKYEEIYMLRTLSINHFISAIEDGHIFVDFDARTGHNHGTKFRIPREHLPDLYEEVKEI